MSRQTWLMAALLAALGLYYFTQSLESRMSENRALAHKSIAETAEPTDAQAPPQDSE